MKILFSDNSLWGLLNFRGCIIRQFILKGYDVVLVAPMDPEGRQMKIPDGAKYIPIIMNRAGVNPVADLYYYYRVRKIYRQEHPDYIFHYTIKPNIYGTFAARSLKIPTTVMIAGLGYAFAEKTIPAIIARVMYKCALRCVDHVFVLNENNYHILIDRKIVSESKLIWLRGGEGVDLNRFIFRNLPTNKKPRFLMVTRLLYDKGYSVLIQGSHFQWEFVKSIPESYKPGIPSRDALQLRIVTSKIIDFLQSKYDCNFKDRVLLGTSFGALTTLFIANEESRENILNIKKYISINPPIDIIFAMKQVDKNSEQWAEKYENLKDNAASTAAKVINISDNKKAKDFKIGELPFSEDEAKLITGFIMHQKLSDLIFTLENTFPSKRCEIYNTINNMNYQDYAKKYLLSDEVQTIDDLAFESSLYSIEEYLKKNSNYRIYHTMDDYLVSKKQLAYLKKCTGDKTILISNGAHLGFMYRQEFLDSLNKDIEN